MLWYRTKETIIEQWQADSAYSLEAGKEPLFNMGCSNTIIDGLLGIRTLQKIIEKRESVVEPAIAMGGECSLWLFVLLQTSRSYSKSLQNDKQMYGNRIRHNAMEPTVIFTAIDSATHMAALTSQTAASRSDTTNALPPKVRWTGLNTGMYHLFAPASEPSANSPIESLPFAIRPIQYQHHLDRYTQVNALTRHSDSSTSTDEQTVWTRRALIGLAILMIITALFV